MRLFASGDDSLTDKVVLRSFAREETCAVNSGWYLHSVHLGGRDGHRIFETFATAIKNDSIDSHIRSDLSFSFCCSDCEYFIISL